MKYICSFCNKSYSSTQSRCNHIRKYHSSIVSTINVDASTETSPLQIKASTDILINTPTTILPNEEEKIYSCSKCQKIFSHRQSKWRHQKECKDDKIKELIKEEIKKEQEKNEKETAEMKAEMKAEVEELRKLIKKSNKKNSKIINSNNNTNNGVINNIHINALGSENLLEKLTDKEKIDLLTSLMFKESPIIELQRQIYNNDNLKENRNTIINNLRSSNCLTYNEDKHQFDAVNKNNHLDKIIENRKLDLIKMLKEMLNKIKVHHRNILEEYLGKIEGTKDSEFYKEHKEEISFIIYNCKQYMNEIRKNIEKLDKIENDSEDGTPDENIEL